MDIGSKNDYPSCALSNFAAHKFEIDGVKCASMKDYKDAMKGIFTSCVSSATIDESPMAYKPMDEIIKNIEPTCEIEKIIKPVYNFKAAF